MKNLYSPSMLKSYLSCKYTIFNEVNEKKLNLKKIELSKNDQLRVEKGNVHEKNYLKELKKKFKKVIDLKNSDLTKEEKVPKTIQAMKEGWEIIYGGYLKRDDVHIVANEYRQISTLYHTKYFNIFFALSIINPEPRSLKVFSLLNVIKRLEN